MLTCHPAAVTCDGDDECSDGWKSNELRGTSDLIGGNGCYPACDNMADFQDLSLDGAPCKTFRYSFSAC